MTLTPREKLFAGAMLFNRLAPYFASALASLIRREVHGLGTFGVTADGVLMFDLDAIKDATVERVAAILAHEVQHPLLKHFARAKALNVLPHTPEARIANIAMDACINEAMRKAGTWDVGSDWVFPEGIDQPEGLIFEERYRRLMEKYREQGGQGQGQGQEGQEQGPFPQFGSKPGAGTGWCGSAAGNPLPGEVPGEGRSEAEMERTRRQTAAEIRQHVANKGRGTIGADLERWADEMLSPPKIPWQEKLGRIVRAAVAYRPGCVDLTWNRPSRRQAGLGYGFGVPLLPAFHAPVPRVAVIIDTSGSMGEAELTAAVDETRGILQAVGADVTLCTCDAAVHGLKQIVQWDPALLVGGGGTDMRPAFNEIEKLTPGARPEVVVVLTDGQIGDGYPADEPDWCKAIWVVVGAHRIANCCPWGEIVEIDGDDVKEVR